MQNRGRLAEKRTIPLPPNRVPKKELSSIFSSDDSEGSERASGDHAHIKQEEELPYSIMRKRWDATFDTWNRSCLLQTLIINETHAEPRKKTNSRPGLVTTVTKVSLKNVLVNSRPFCLFSDGNLNKMAHQHTSSFHQKWFYGYSEVINAHFQTNKEQRF